MAQTPQEAQNTGGRQAASLVTAARRLRTPHMAPNDDAMTYVMDSMSEDSTIQEKLECVSRLRVIALALGAERTRKELLPFLRTLRDPPVRGLRRGWLGAFRSGSHVQPLPPERTPCAPGDHGMPSILAAPSLHAAARAASRRARAPAALLPDRPASLRFRRSCMRSLTTWWETRF